MQASCILSGTEKRQGNYELPAGDFKVLTEPVELFEVELGKAASKHPSCGEGSYFTSGKSILVLCAVSMAFCAEADVNDIPARAQYSFPGITTGTCNMVVWQGAEIWAVLEIA